MQPFPFATASSGGNGIDAVVARADATPVRVCVHGTADAHALSTLRARLPASATVSLLGRCAVDAAWDDAERLPEVAEGEHPS
ncbi:MAG: hypothetical protein ABIR62_03755, partial [Dokdonella sp.]|uniref:hypothetical protein n=1 Tax=Dokdonella sp. TaxID=2291710 RepID=UPI00326594DC